MIVTWRHAYEGVLLGASAAPPSVVGTRPHLGARRQDSPPLKILEGQAQSLPTASPLPVLIQGKLVMQQLFSRWEERKEMNN